MQSEREQTLVLRFSSPQVLRFSRFSGSPHSSMVSLLSMYLFLGSPVLCFYGFTHLYSGALAL